MPNSKSRNFFENIVTGLSNLQKQLTLYQKQSVANLKLAKAVARSNARLKQQNATLKQTITRLKQTERQVRNTTKSVQFMSVTWQGVARVMVGSLVSRGIQELVNAFTQAGESATEFSIRISEIRTISQSAQQSFDQWSQSVRSLSDQFGLPILDAAAATYETLSNQIAEGAEANIFMAEAAKFSRTSVATLEESVDLLSGTINAYGMNMSAVSDVAATFFKAIDLGRFRAEDLANTFGRLTSLGARLDISYQELLASMTVMTRRGIPVAEAMTYMRNAMLALIKPTKEMTKWLKDRFGTASAEAVLAAQGLPAVIAAITKEMEKSSSPIQDFASRFNRIRGLMGVVGAATQEYQSDLAQLTNATEEYNNASKITLENVGKQWQILTQQLKNAILFQINIPLKKTLISAAESVGDLAGKLEKILNLLKDLIWPAAFIATMKLIGPRIVAIGIAIKSWAAALIASGVQLTAFNVLLHGTRTLAASITALLGGWKGLLVLAGAGIIYYYKKHKDAKAALQKDTEEFFNQELLQYQAMTDAKIAKELRLMEVKQSAIRETLDASLKTLRVQRDAVQALINKEEELIAKANMLKDSLMAYDMLLARNDPKKQINLLKSSLQDLVGQLPDVLKSGDQQAIDNLNNRILSTARQLYALDGKRVKASADMVAKYGSAFQMGKNFLYTTTKTAKWTDSLVKKAKALNQQYANAAKEQRELSDKGLETEKQRLKNINDRLTKIDEEAKKLADLQSQQQKAHLAQETAIKEAVTLAEQLRQQLFEGLGPSLAKLLVKFFGSGEGGLLGEFQKLQDQEIVTPEQIANAKAKLAELEEKLKSLEESGWLPEEFFTRAREGLTELSTKLDDIITKAGEKEAISGQLQQAQERINVINEGVNVLQQYAIQFAETNKQAFEGTAAQARLLDQTTQAMNATLAAGHANALAFIQAAKQAAEAAREAAAASRDFQRSGWYFGGPITRQAGGSIGKDSVSILASPREFIMNERATSKFLPQLIAMNSGSKRFESGGTVNNNNNIGDINVSVLETKAQPREIAAAIRRELTRNTVRLN